MSIYKPYHLLLLAGLSLLISALIPTDQTLDIHVHDTYFVIAHSSLYWVFAIFTYFLWGVYVLARNTLFSNWLTWFHVVITLLTVAFFICLPFFGNLPGYIDVSSWLSFNKFQRVLASIALLFIVAQLMLVMNIVGGLFIWLRNRWFIHKYC